MNLIMPFYFIAEWHSIVYMNQISAIYSSVYGHIICSHFLGIVILWTERQWAWTTKFLCSRLCLPLGRFEGAKMMIWYNAAQVLWMRHEEYQGRKILGYMKRKNKVWQMVQYPLLLNSGYDVLLTHSLPTILSLSWLPKYSNFEQK